MEPTPNYDAIVDALSDLYIQFRGRFVMSVNGRTFVPKDGKGKCSRLHSENIYAHLKNGKTVSVYAGPKCTKFMTFDVDDGSPATVRAIIEQLDLMGIPEKYVYVSMSGKKGYHVELFFDDGMRVNALLALYDYVCEEAGVDMARVEFRPTMNLSIKLPLGQHPDTGKTCWFVDQKTLEPIEDMNYILGIQKLHCDYVYDIINAHCKNRIGWRQRRRAKPIPKAETIELTRTGATHNTMVSIAVYLVNKGATHDEIVSYLNDWIARQNPEFFSDPLGDIRRDAQEIAAWVCGDGFRRRRRIPPVSFCEEELAELLKKRARVPRRVLFALMYYQKRRGGDYVKIGAEELAQELGYTRMGVIKAVNLLEAEGVLSHERCGVVKMGSEYHGESNKYFVKKYDGEGGLTTDEKHGANGAWAYLMAEAVPSLDERRKMFTAKELEDIEKYGNQRSCEEPEVCKAAV